MQKKGITIVELLVVLSVIGILVTAVDVSFEQWLERYEVEKITKELYHDLMYARLMAVEKNVKYLAVLNAHKYTMAEDLNENGDIDPGEELPAYPRTVRYELTWNSGTQASVFDTRGLMTPNRTIWVKSGVRADFDCMKISRSRIISGRYDEEDKECVAR